MRVTILVTLTTQLLMANTLRRSKLTSFYSNFKNNASHSGVLSVVGSSRVNACKILKLLFCCKLV